MIPFYTEKADQVRKQAREFGEWLGPRDRVLEESKEIPGEILAELWERGYYGYLIPRELGGAGGSLFELALILEELSSRSSSVSLSLLIQALGVSLLSQEPEEEKRKRLLARVVNERKLLAFALSEPGSESFETRAEVSGTGYKLSGRKVYVNQAREADWVLVLAKFEQGLGLVLTAKGSAGIIVSREFTRHSACGLSWGEVLIQEAEVDPESLIGKPGDGERITERSLSAAAVLVAASALGLLEAVMKMEWDGHLAKPWSRERLQQEAQPELEAGRALCFQSGYGLDKHLPGSERAALAAKVFCTELACKWFSRFTDLAGAPGISADGNLKPWSEFAVLLRTLLGSNAFLRESLAGME